MAAIYRKQTHMAEGDAATFGACSVEGRDELRGQPLPRVRLMSHTSRSVDPGEMGGEGPLAIYVYPGCVCSPEDDYQSPALDAMQHRVFAARGSEFLAMGCRLVGISSQSVEGQRRAAADTGATHMLLSDPGLRLARALGLATFNVDGADWYCRMTLVVVEGIVAETFTARGAGGAAQAIAWLRAQGF
jgi:peroxiredoxin